jgi:nicotinamide-nucleotide amidase
VAAAMATGAAERSGARLAISTTGIAGPTGGTVDKPVGLVQIGVSLDGVVETHERRFPPRGRVFVRNWSANTACDLARRRLLDAGF